MALLAAPRGGEAETTPALAAALGGGRPGAAPGGGPGDSESDASTASDQQEPRGWRRLPTAWIHLLWVESFHVYTAILAWISLMNKINVGSAMPGVSELMKHLNGYFQSLFFFGSTKSVTIRLDNITDDFFLQDAGGSIVTDCSTISLPATSLHSLANWIWVPLAWSVPVAGGVVMVFIVSNMYSAGISSFESMAYLRFTWRLYKRPGFRYCVGLMCIGPVLLPLVWMVQIVLFGLQSQWAVLGESIPSGFLLLFSLDFLAFPTTPVHEWPRNSEELASIQFRRSLLHLFLGGNNNFGVKLMDALWTAQHGDLSRLERYLADPRQARSVLEMCCLEQQAEAEKKHMLSRRKGAAGKEDSDGPAE